MDKARPTHAEIDQHLKQMDAVLFVAAQGLGKMARIVREDHSDLDDTLAASRLRHAVDRIDREIESLNI